MYNEQPYGEALSKLTAAKPKIYYGWVVATSLMVTGIMGIAMGVLNLGLFINPMGADLGISKATFGWAQTARLVTGAATSPIIGRILDRFGPRVLLSIAGLIAGVIFVLMGSVSSSWQFIALFAAVGLLGGFNSTGMYASVTLAKWFVRLRGRAMALTSLGDPIGGAAFVTLTQLFIDLYGWRDAWRILGILGAAVVVPVALSFLRRQPEDMGLAPDGDDQSAKAVVQPPTKTLGLKRRQREAEASWSYDEARRSMSFWRLVLVFSIGTLGMSTIALYRIPAFVEKGFDPTTAALSLSAAAAMSGVGSFSMGFLVEVFEARFIGAFSFVLLAVASLLFVIANSVPLMFLSMMLWGFGIGGTQLLQNFMWADYFGRKNLGAIRGIVMPATMLASGIGAPAAGYARDFSGSYNPAWMTGTVLMGLGAIAIAATPRPKKSA